MGINFGTNSLENAYFGSDEVQSIYLGDQEVWSNMDWDFVDNNQYDEIDFLYTCDNHNFWRGGNEEHTYHDTSLNWSDVANYKNNLNNTTSTRIKALALDGGDEFRGKTSHGSPTDVDKNQIKNFLNTVRYFGAAIGNNEYENHARDLIPYLRQVVDDNGKESYIACNLFYGSSVATANKLVFKPYKTAKISGKKIAVIGVAYPYIERPGDGGGAGWTHSVQDGVYYRTLIGNDLFNTMQAYIDYFNQKHFDHIIILQHGGYGTEGDGSPGPSNYLTSLHGYTILSLADTHEWRVNSITAQDNRGGNVHVMAQPGCYFDGVVRLRIYLTGSKAGTIESKATRTTSW